METQVSGTIPKPFPTLRGLAGMKTLLVLEDNDERIEAFSGAVRKLGEDWRLK